MTPEFYINKEILIWAVARAGYRLDEFELKFPKIQEWINKTKAPTIKQLEVFSKKVHLPFGYLFLETPPKEALPIPFFRTNGKNDDIMNLNIYDTIILLQQRQSWLKEYLKDNDYKKLSFVGKFNENANYQEIVADIRKTLDISIDWAKSFQTWHETLNHLTSKIEDAGIIVIFNGVVENNTSRPIKVEDCRGFVLVDKVAPFMFINNADAKAAQLFTIIHELAHIWTGQSAGFDFRKMQPANNNLEILCDKVAAEFLVPSESFQHIWQRCNGNINLTAKYFKVSEIVIARRALDLGKINKSIFFTFYDNYINREIDKKKKQNGGGDFYATARKRISITFASHVNQAVKSGNLLYRDAYKLTSMQGDTFQNFFSKNFQQ